MCKQLLRALFALVVLVALAAPAKADSVSVGPGCTNCNGNVVTLTVTGTTITLSINTSGATNMGQAVAWVDFKIPGLTEADVTFTSFSGGGTWNPANGPGNANGCQGTNATFVCVEAANFDTAGSAMGAIVNGTTLTWTWTINISGTFSAANATHIGVGWDDVVNGNYTGNPTNGIISENPIPEPGTMALFGTGLIGLAGVIRRRLNL